MSLITKTVGSGLGRDFVTWQEAIDAIPKDLIADGNAYELVGFADTEFTSTTGRVINITGFTCDATHNIKLRTAPGQSWREFSGIQAAPLRYDMQHGVALVASGEYSGTIFSDANFLEIDGLQIKGASYSLRALDLRGNNCKITNTIIDARPGDYIVYCTGSRALVDNCVIINRQPNTVAMGIGDGSLVVNSTIVMASEYAGTHGIVNFGGTGPSAESVVNNTAIFGYASAVTNYFTGTNNATDAPDYSGNTGAFTNSLAGLVKTNQFKDMTLAGMDLRTKLGSALIDGGAPVPNVMSANGIARPSGAGFDIGAWEFVVPATSVNASAAAAGFVGHASDITITTNGSLTGNVVVTPSDNGAGGAFSPATLTLTPTASSGVIQYTAAAPGNVNLSFTSNGGLGSPAPLAFLASFKAPTGVIVNQPAPDGQNLVVPFTTSDNPTSGMATLSADPINPAGASTTSGVVELSLNAAIATFTGIPPGNYNLVITVTSSAGTTSVSGAQPVSIIGISGNPQLDITPPVVVVPVPTATVTGVTLTPATVTVQGGATQQFTAAVQGTNNPGQTVTYTTSGGTISASGLLTAPAASSNAQVITVTARSTVDATKTATATVNVPATSVVVTPPSNTPTVTGVTVTPTTATVDSGTQQFVATVQGTNSPSQAVTWTTDLGSINAAGLLTVAKTNAIQHGTVTATSVADSTKLATASITVAAIEVQIDPTDPESPSQIPGTMVSMHFISPNGEPIAHTDVEIQLKASDYRTDMSAMFMPRLITAVTDFDGRCTVKLMPCDTLYYVTVYDSISEAGLFYKFYVPTVQDPSFVVRLQDILVDAEISGPSFDEAAQLLIVEAKANAIAAAAAAKASEDAVRALLAALGNGTVGTGGTGTGSTGGTGGTGGTGNTGGSTGGGTGSGGIGGGTGTGGTGTTGGSGVASPGPAATSGNRPEVLLVADANNTIHPDGALSNRFRFVLTADTKLADPVNFATNEHLYFTGYQDSVGAHKLGYGLSLLLPDAQPYAPPAGPKSAFLLELRPTVNMNTNALNWTVLGYPDKSVVNGFSQTSEIAYVGTAGYFTISTSYDGLVNGGTVKIVRNGKSQEATGTKTGVAGETYLIAGAPVDINGADKRPILQLGLTDFASGQPNRPSYGKALLNFEGQGTFTVRDLRITHVRNASGDARGICANDSGANLILENVEITDAHNGVLSGNSPTCGDITMNDVRIDLCGMGGPTGDPERPDSGGFTHGTYFGHNNSHVTMNRVSVTNAVEGNNLKCRTGNLTINQVLCQNSSAGRELEFSNGGVLHATDCIFSRQFTNSGINTLSTIGNANAPNGQEGVDTSRPREYIFTNCRFEFLLNVPGRDPTFICSLDPTVPMTFIDCEFIGVQALANQLTPTGTGNELFNGTVTVNGIRYFPAAPPVFVNTPGVTPGPRVPVGYFPVPMTAMA